MSKKNLLVVGGHDDDRAFVAGVAVIDLGYDITTCDTLAEAWDLCNVQLPDGILIDVDAGMSEGDSVNFIRELKLLHGSNKISVIVLASANNLVDEFYAAREAGATGYVAKPYNSEDALRGKIRM